MSGIMRAAARGARRLESSRVTSHARASIAPFHRIDGSEKSWNPSAAQIREPVGLPGMTFTPWGGVSDGEKISALEGGFDAEKIQAVRAAAGGKASEE